MPYRRTDNVVRRMAARERAILASARALASEEGMAGVQIADVARRAGIAAGTVYRYFPSKADLIAALVADIAASELGAMRAAANGAPGPLSALAAGIATFGARAVAERSLAWAAIAEPVDSEIDTVRFDFRRSLVIEWEARIRSALDARLLPEQNPRASAAAILGMMMEGLVGPLAPSPGMDRNAQRDAVQNATLFCLRALGVLDARARGLVAQVVLP